MSICLASAVLLVCSNFTAGSLATCRMRRCLASQIVAADLFSPPMPPGCSITVNLTSIQYETLAVVKYPPSAINTIIFSSFLESLVNIRGQTELKWSNWNSFSALVWTQDTKALRFSSRIRIDMVRMLVLIRQIGTHDDKWPVTRQKESFFSDFNRNGTTQALHGTIRSMTFQRLCCQLTKSGLLI